MKRVETDTLILKSDGFTLTVSGAPALLNRNENGIREMLKRSRVTADVACTWDHLREYAASVGVFIDPLDDQPEEPDPRIPKCPYASGHY